MTREDIARSLKPIQWIYTYSYLTCRATFGIGGKRFNVEIETPIGIETESYLTISMGRKKIHEGYKKVHKTIYEAMEDARNFLVNGVCDLFDLEED